MIRAAYVITRRMLTARSGLIDRTMNPYLKHLNKIEFSVSYACNGRCRHCSVGSHTSTAEMPDPHLAARAVREIASVYDIKTAMVFGGEPLLFADAVCTIMRAAAEMEIPRRQVITNGCFSKNADEIRNVALRLLECGVNDLLVSVDAFHQETLPLETVKLFVREAKVLGIPVRLQPAWLVSCEDDNEYNRKTRALLCDFSDLGILENEGNVVFPEGNALTYLAQYFTGELPKNPYCEDPFDVRCVSFSPNGDVLSGNLYRTDVIQILNAYDPCS